MAALPPVAPEIAARLANYRIDDPARELLRDMRSLIQPHVGDAIDQVIEGAARLPQVAALYKKHGSDIRRFEIAQYQTMLKADFDAGYLECCRNTTEQEILLGFEGRARMNCAAAVLR